MRNRTTEKPDPDLKAVLRAVNRARKTMGMEPLKEMPLGIPTLTGHSSLARALGGAVGTSEKCPCCGHIIARVYLVETHSPAFPDDPRSVTEARKRISALHCLWPRARYRTGREGWIEIPQLLARFDIAFHCQQYPALFDPDGACFIRPKKVLPLRRKAT